MPATWRWCARHHRRVSGDACLGDAVGREPGQCEAGAIAGSVCPSASRRRALPRIKLIDMRRHAAGARQVPVAAAGRRNSADAGTQGTVAAVPQPARLCAADALPGLRPPLPMPGLLGLAGRAPLSRRMLVCHHCGHHEPVPEACPECGTLDHLVACGPGVERIAEEVAGAVPGRAHDRALVRYAAAASSGCGWNWRRLPRARPILSSARNSSPRAINFPLHDTGRRGRCRSWPRQWRSARRRADIPAAAAR